MATLCEPHTLALTDTWDCLPRDQQDRLAFDMIRYVAYNNIVVDIDVESEAPCVWNRFSDRQKWSVILFSLCAIAVHNYRSYECKVCRDELPGDFLGLNRDDQMRAWLALLSEFVDHYDGGGEFDEFREQYDEPCRDSKWRLNVLLNIALQFLDELGVYDTDPNVLMCSDNNPYWNVKEQDVPAWLFQLICDIYNILTNPT